MGGFFGATSRRNCVLDVFFGTDYHSHLGTRRGGMAAFDPEKGLQREIHNIENFGTVICACGGLGAAPMLPIIRGLKAAGNRVLSVIAGRTAELVIMEDEIRESSDEVIIMTDDGSKGEKGVVTVGIEKFCQQEHIDKAFAIGPPIMMKFSCLMTQKYGISTDVSLNTIMVDGTGMCGACRLTIGGKTKFVCIDGPEFDGALVDWDEMSYALKIGNESFSESFYFDDAE